MSPPPELHAELDRFVDGELPAEEAARFREHLATCEPCRAALRGRVQLAGLARDALGGGAKVILLARWRARTAGAAVAALAAGLVAVVLARGGRVEEDPALWLANAPARPLEARFSSPGADRYRPYEVTRGESPGPGDADAAASGRVDRAQRAVAPPSLQALAALEEKGRFVAIAEAYLVRGTPELARAYLDRAGAGPDALATRAVLDLMVGRPEDALRHANAALREREGHLAARWNRALALRALGLAVGAAAELERVAAAKEPGWSEEASELAKRLRAEVERRRAAYLGGLGRCRQATLGQAAFPADVADVSLRLARVCFYDALRGAGTAEAVRALSPVATALDARFGGGTLAGAVADVLGRSLKGREALSREYGAVVTGQRGAEAIAALARGAAAAGQPDIELGAMYFLPLERLDLERYRALARRTGDPWFEALADEKAATAQSVSQPIRALELLLPRIRDCAGSEHVERRCLTVERLLVRIYSVLHQGAQARAAAARALERARREGDTGTELWLIEDLGQVARTQSDLDLAHAYLEEGLLRAPRDCEVVQYSRGELALVHHRRLEYAEARRQVDLGTGCDRPPPLQFLAELAELERVDPRPGDAAVFERGLEAARRSTRPGSGDAALLVHYEGRFALPSDPVKGAALLRRSLQEADAVPAGDAMARKVRAYGFTSLILEAGRRGDMAGALALFGEELRATAPLRCVLGLAADDDRFLAVAVGADGQVAGRAEGAPAAPAARAGPAYPEVMQVLRGCAEVQVLARPPLDAGEARLGPEVAWSLHAGGPPPAGAGRGPRLLISGVLPPAELRLPLLRGAESESGGALVHLSGAEATPGRVMQAMQEASEIEIRAHGIVDTATADGSYLALSPDADGRFALTAADVRTVRLKGHPLVLLAACHSAETVPYAHQGYGLPEAFIEAGARAVLAATAPIPDADGDAFFKSLMERIRGGVSPATALRDARVAWRGKPGAGWVDSVILFE